MGCLVEIVNYEDVLKSYIITHLSQSKLCLYDQLMELYKVFFDASVRDIDQMKQSSKVFYSFLNNNIDLFDHYTEDAETKKEIFRLVYNEIYKAIYSATTSKIVKQFVGTVKDILPSKDMNLLDVGSGQIPYSSILFAKDLGEVTSMDKKFIVSIDGLRNFGVNAREEMFNVNTPIDQYDMVVGCTPCSAIDSMVYVCHKYKKPYYIVTCDCEMPTVLAFREKYNIDHEISIKDGAQNFLIDPQTLSTYNIKWRKLLRELDDGIKFMGNIAYNVDASEDEVRQVILENQFLMGQRRGKDILQQLFADSNDDAEWTKEK